ncbi:hypothetical protein [Nocardia brasiliensis]|uniref:hypothetical protein n=1 Tax=Nocardia brasiliensis TaxID=37326 RepID=UPI001894790A|nr:hypothetical protein [Nocardia brasiliensis]MBF6546635.1 hypothetical protein [Nocardia brasiliensis]
MTIALLVRGLTIPPGWVFDEPALAADPHAARSRLTRRYRTARIASIGSVVLDLVVTQKISARSTMLLLSCERLTATRLAGFAPYIDHLYVYACYVWFATRAAEHERGSRGTPPVAYLPATIYLASALAKLCNGAQSWLRTGDIVGNALQLYGWNKASTMAAGVDPVVLSRIALAFEAMALPVSASGPGGLRAMSLLGLTFHATNFVMLRVSFWHLAFMHLPILYAVRPRGPQEE